MVHFLKKMVWQDLAELWPKTELQGSKLFLKSFQHWICWGSKVILWSQIWRIFCLQCQGSWMGTNMTMSKLLSTYLNYLRPYNYFCAPYESIIENLRTNWHTWNYVFGHSSAKSCEIICFSSENVYYWKHSFFISKTFFPGKPSMEIFNNVIIVICKTILFHWNKLVGGYVK